MHNNTNVLLRAFHGPFIQSWLIWFRIQVTNGLMIEALIHFNCEFYWDGLVVMGKEAASKFIFHLFCNKITLLIALINGIFPCKFTEMISRDSNFLGKELKAKFFTITLYCSV